MALARLLLFVVDTDVIQGRDPENSGPAYGFPERARSRTTRAKRSSSETGNDPALLLGGRSSSRGFREDLRTSTHATPEHHPDAHLPADALPWLVKLNTGPGNSGEERKPTAKRTHTGKESTLRCVEAMPPRAPAAGAGRRLSSSCTKETPRDEIASSKRENSRGPLTF